MNPSFYYIAKTAIYFVTLGEIESEVQNGADHTAARVHPSSYSNTVELEGFYHVHTDSGELQETSYSWGKPPWLFKDRAERKSLDMIHSRSQPTRVNILNITSKQCFLKKLNI